MLTRTVAHWYSVGTRFASPSELNFLIFAPIFSLVSVAYLELTPRFAPRAAHPYSSMTFEGLNVIFYFAGFIAFAVFLSQLSFCNKTVCAVGRSVAVVAAAEFVVWIASAILMAKDIFKGGLRKPTVVATGGARTAAPTTAPPMSQA